MSFAFNIPFGVERYVPPAIPDRLEYTFTPTSSTQSCISMLCFSTYDIQLIGYPGQGEEVQGVETSGTARGLYAILGLPSDDPRVEYFKMFPKGITYHGYYNRVNEGTLALELNSIYLSSLSFPYINSLTVPTWCSRLSSGGKVAAKCTDLTFIERSRLQVKDMLVTSSGTATTSQFITQFPNAVCHCMDGDFMPQQLVQ